MANQTDPVCGMQIDTRNAAGTSNFQGQEYYFCSQGCKNKFDRNPQQYVGKAGQAQTGGQKQ